MNPSTHVLHVILEYTAHYTIDDAVEAGNLKCLKLLRKQGCPWDEVTCEAAAYGGHLECLKYLHKNGCPWDERSSRVSEVCPRERMSMG